MNLPILYVGNRNYSSWSLRPWLALTWGGVAHEVRALQLGGEGYGQRAMASVLEVSPTGALPALHVAGAVVTDSLAICEWAAEQSPALWPADPVARALARSAAAEMHAGFSALRNALPCNIRRRAEPRGLAPDAQRDVARVEALWTTLRERFGGDGPYLFGARPTIADAFYTPVATRVRTYRVPLSKVASEYAATLLADPAFRAWEAEAVAETWAMPQWDHA